MSFPTPVPGLVIRYSFLWSHEARAGVEDGRKDRPCAVLLSLCNRNGRDVITVLPVTHAPPSDPDLAVEIPRATKARLGLDGERSWIILDEANRFTWPGLMCARWPAAIREPSLMVSCLKHFTISSAKNGWRPMIAGEQGKPNVVISLTKKDIASNR